MATQPHSSAQGLRLPSRLPSVVHGSKSVHYLHFARARFSTRLLQSVEVPACVASDCRYSDTHHDTGTQPHAATQEQATEEQ